MRYLKWFFREISRFRWTYASVLLFEMIGVAISLLYVWLSKLLVDTAVGHFNGDNQARRLIWLAVAFAVVCLGRPLLMSLRSYMQSKMSVKMTNDLRLRLFDNMLKVCGDPGKKFHSGDMINRMETDVISVTNAFCSDVPHNL